MADRWVLRVLVLALLASPVQARAEQDDAGGPAIEIGIELHRHRETVFERASPRP